MPDSPEPSRSVFRLDTVQVGAVRSLLEVGPLPVQPGMTLIAGRNDGGKTSLFDALRYSQKLWMSQEREAAYPP